MAKTRAILRLIVFLLLTAYSVLLVLIWRPFNRKNPYFFLELERNWAKRLLKAMGIQVELESELPQAHGLLMCNHRSYIDIVMVPPFFPATFVAKQEVRKWPVVGYGCTTIKVIFVDRSSPDSRKKTREDIRNSVLEGLSILVYPEGTTSASPHLHLLKPGMFFVAAEAGIPILPVALEYEQIEDAWVGDETFLPHFLKTFGRKKTRAKIRFGPPIFDSDGEQLREKVTHWMKQNLAEMQEGFGHPKNKETA
jgi:1-acyl-sn-glycerol-3-phosphate acyltransferase